MVRSDMQWLLDSDEPWTRYRTRVDLLGQSENDPQVQAERAKMLTHPQVRALIGEVAAWPGSPLRRHNDASHALHKLSALADFGVRASDRGMASAIRLVKARQSAEGPFRSLLLVPKAFGGKDEPTWAWMACDAPALLSSLLAMGLGNDRRVQRAVSHLLSQVQDNGWRCLVSTEMGSFRGPGRKDDPCPIATVYALKALAQVPELRKSRAAHAGAEMLLAHWEHRGQKKYFLFGIGTDFGKLKYPFVWYDILHVLDVLSQFPWARADARYRAMLESVISQGDDQGHYTAGSMYLAWKGWSFADKKRPSPWLTFLVLRLQKRSKQKATAQADKGTGDSRND